jgi:ABC-type Fe3+-hydroxamate transport system substrate-binding protein
MERFLRSALPSLVMSVLLLGCTSSATDKKPEPLSAASAGPAGVTLVLGATHTPNGCCRVFTMNPGTDLTVFCSLVALDPAGRLVYAGVVPAKLPGHLRSSGFEAPPGRHGHGVVQLPIDLALDSYTAPCRPAAWHGGAPI